MKMRALRRYSYKVEDRKRWAIFPSSERVEKKIFRRIPHRWESNVTFLNDKEFVEIDVFIL